MTNDFERLKEANKKVQKLLTAARRALWWIDAVVESGAYPELHGRTTRPMLREAIKFAEEGKK